MIWHLWSTFQHFGRTAYSSTQPFQKGCVCAVMEGGNPPKGYECLNFSPLLHAGTHGTSHRHLLLLVLLPNFQMTLGKPLLPFRPQSSHLQNKEVFQGLAAWALWIHSVLGHGNDSEQA